MCIPSEVSVATRNATGFSKNEGVMEGIVHVDTTASKVQRHEAQLQAKIQEALLEGKLILKNKRASNQNRIDELSACFHQDESYAIAMFLPH